MAAILKIKQSRLTHNKLEQIRIDEFCNTSQADDIILIKNAFAPLLALKELGHLTNTELSAYNKVYDRFFDDGKYLYLAQYNTLNDLLTKHNLFTVELENNGEYDQPNGNVNKGSTNERTSIFEVYGDYRLNILNESFKDLVSTFDSIQSYIDSMKVQSTTLNNFTEEK